MKPVSLPTLNFHQFNPHVQFNASDYVNAHGEPIHRIRMVDVTPHGPWSMGELRWHGHTGEITNVETEPDYQRLGVANTLLEEARRAAKEHGLESPVHSSNRTEDGQAWAKATKDKLPRRKRVNYFN